MSRKITAHDIVLDQVVGNDAGAWVELKFDPDGGYASGLGPTGTYYLRHWSPCFVEGARIAVGTPSRDRAKIVRQALNWLKSRPLTAEEIAEFERIHG